MVNFGVIWAHKSRRSGGNSDKKSHPGRNSGLERTAAHFQLRGQSILRISLERARVWIDGAAVVLGEESVQIGAKTVVSAIRARQRRGQSAAEQTRPEYFQANPM